MRKRKEVNFYLFWYVWSKGCAASFEGATGGRNIINQNYLTDRRPVDIIFLANEYPFEVREARGTVEMTLGGWVRDSF